MVVGDSRRIGDCGLGGDDGIGDVGDDEVLVANDAGDGGVVVEFRVDLKWINQGTVMTF